MENLKSSTQQSKDKRNSNDKTGLPTMAEMQKKLGYDANETKRNPEEVFGISDARRHDIEEDVKQLAEGSCHICKDGTLFDNKAYHDGLKNELLPHCNTSEAFLVGSIHEQASDIVYSQMSRRNGGRPDFSGILNFLKGL